MRLRVRLRRFLWVSAAYLFSLLCCVVFLFLLCLSSSFVLCAQCCQCLCMVHSWLPLRFSLTFIYTRCGKLECHDIKWIIKNDRLPYIILVIPFRIIFNFNGKCTFYATQMVSFCDLINHWIELMYSRIEREMTKCPTVIINWSQMRNKIESSHIQYVYGPHRRSVSYIYYQFSCTT